MTAPIRWLHLSDFHVGKDRSAQTRLFDEIIQHVTEEKSKGLVPDLVFVTGDIANHGKKKEYEEFRKVFFRPLSDLLGSRCKIFAVPGNHDVARPEPYALDRGLLIQPESRFFDFDKSGKTARANHVTRQFLHYKKEMVGDVPSAWVDSEAGSYSEIIECQGYQVGIVGINTAWLSMDEHDKEKLTPGFPLVEEALKKIASCHVRIVLGHHPLSWLHEDDRRQLRGLFGRHKVIYLHGHRHRAEGRQEEGAGQFFLALQAGAAFQARGSGIWENGFTWGEVDVSCGEVRVSPRVWNSVHGDWPARTGAFPESRQVPGRADWWWLALPGADELRAKDGSAWQPPAGWICIDNAFLDGHRRNITPIEANRFFDGAEPDWSLALCPEIPRLAIVGKVVDQISNYRGSERPQVAFLIGPGGEGRSMALRQVVVDTLRQQQNLRVLWQRDDTAGISSAQLQALPQGNHVWLIVTDKGDMVAKSLHQGVQALARAGRGDVRFLIGARDSDWRLAGASQLTWRSYGEEVSFPMSGLSDEDALIIAGAWLACDLIGGAGLSSETPELLAQRLLAAAKQESVHAEGALLGGVLAVRLGPMGLRSHVRSLLDRFSDIPLSTGGTLRDAFIYIAAMHTEGLDFLSRQVLAEGLVCDEEILQREVISALAKEAAANGGTSILTRHRRIAEAAVAVMQEDLGESVDSVYPLLAKAAHAARRNGFVPELGKWDYLLPNHFLSRGQDDLSIRIGRALLDSSPENSMLAVNFAKICREAKRPGQGAKILHDFSYPVLSNRGFWYEWATCVGNTGNHALSAWLGGWSLADGAASTPPDNDSSKLTLAGLGVAFGGLYETYVESVFIEARGAVGLLGSTLKLDSDSRRYFENYRAEAAEAGVAEGTLTEAIALLNAGLERAWECCPERDELAERLPKPSLMRFEGLKRRIGVE